MSGEAAAISGHVLRATSWKASEAAAASLPVCISTSTASFAVGVQIATDQAGLAGGEFHLWRTCRGPCFRRWAITPSRASLHGDGGVGHERSGEQRFESRIRPWQPGPPCLSRSPELVAASHEASVSHLTSTATPDLPSGGQSKAHETFEVARGRPSGGLERPFWRSQSTAFSMSPSHSVGAFFAVHHARGGLFAQVFNHSSSDAHENLRKTLVIRRRLRQRGGLLQPWASASATLQFFPRRPCSWNPCAWLHLRGRLRPWR